jgi:hypothetical protein
MFKASYNRENAEEVEVWNHPDENPLPPSFSTFLEN